jgi:hypothetical protein
MWTAAFKHFGPPSQLKVPMQFPVRPGWGGAHHREDKRFRAWERNLGC